MDIWKWYSSISYFVIITIHTRHCAGQPIQFISNETAAHSTGWWIVLPGIEAYYSNFKLQFIPHANLFELIIIPSSSLQHHKRSPCLLLFVLRLVKWKTSLLSLSLPCQVLQHSSTHPICNNYLACMTEWCEIYTFKCKWRRRLMLKRMVWFLFVYMLHMLFISLIRLSESCA